MVWIIFAAATGSLFAALLLFKCCAQVNLGRDPRAAVHKAETELHADMPCKEKDNLSTSSPAKNNLNKSDDNKNSSKRDDIGTSSKSSSWSSNSDFDGDYFEDDMKPVETLNITTEPEEDAFVLVDGDEYDFGENEILSSSTEE